MSFSKYMTLGLWVAVVIVAGTGCAKKTSHASVSPGVTDVAPLSATPVAYTPAPAYEPAPMTTYTPTAPAQTAGGSSYKVKKGDTLYGIARTQYGDGKQWTRIASANPGVSPSSLKVGQTIVVP